MRPLALLGFLLWVAAGVALFLPMHCAGETGIATAGSIPAAGDPAVTNVLIPIREKHHMPAIAAAIVTSKGLTASGVVGTRKAGAMVPATLQDKWHLGSDAKAMTATVCARLVERGLLKWDSTLAETFPELADGFHAQSRSITLQQLLCHRSGLKANPHLPSYRGRDGTAERLRLIKNELKYAPPYLPGTRFEYSNLGYSIAGAMIEKVTGQAWEAAMQKELFEPLGMKSVGFGGTGTPGTLDQPWGHDAEGNPVRGNGPSVDNPPVLSPAGRIHCTIQDWALFIRDQLRGARGEKALLSPDSYRKLQTPVEGQEYGLGWMIVDRDWGGGRVLHHVGDNTMNHANAWLAPQRDFAVLICINQSGDQAFAASDAAIGAIIKKLERQNASEKEGNGLADR